MRDQDPSALRPRFANNAVRHEFTGSRVIDCGRRVLAWLHGDMVYAPIKVTIPESDLEIQIDLITPKHFDRLPDGSVLLDLRGEPVVKGRDPVSDDERRGILSVGLRTQTPSPNMYVGPYRAS